MPSTVPPTKNWAIVLIHGVGDTSAGSMLEAVATQMTAINPGLTLDPHKEHSKLEETDPVTKKPRKFTVFRQRAHSSTDKVLFAEVYWADLTRVGVDTPNLFFALVSFVYGLRHIALQAALLPGRLAATLTVALRLTMLLLLGPVFALFLFEALLYALYLLFVPNTWDIPGSFREIGFVYQGVLSINVISVCGLFRRFRTSVLWPGILVVGTLILGHLLLRATGGAEGWYENVLLPSIGFPQGKMPGEWVLSGFAIDYVLNRLLGLVACGIILAGLVVLLARIFADRPTFVGMWTAWLAVVLLDTCWEILIMPIDLIAQWAYDRSERAVTASTVEPKYTLWFDEMCLAALAVALLVSATATVVAHIRWAERHSDKESTLTPDKGLAPACPDTKRQETRSPRVRKSPTVAPRLIVAFPLQICLLVFAWVLCPLAVIDGFDIWQLRIACIDYRLVYLFYVLVLVAILGGSLGVRNVLHILHDIVVHFASPAADRLVLRSRRTVLRYQKRYLIAKRLRKVLDQALSENPTHLLVIAHSQGSIIALEELRKRRWHRAFAGLKSRGLLTFGCPLTHLYQHYFPFLYRDVTQGRWNMLRNNVEIWRNIYRSDDYVGTYVDSSDPKWPINVPLPPGECLKGHTRYWEPEVFRSINEVLPR